ncbi:MAG TPA: PAS domain S-box protein, partial [Pyrinomonadaceae bacterium]|nr:PAS domain S-box protein [Pyrinomonadaceae bacterium]
MASTYTPKEQPVAADQSVLTPDLYREIFAHSNEPIAIIDPQGRYLEQNRAHRDLLGYSDEELKGQTPAIHADPETFKTIIEQLTASGEYRGEIVNRRKNGELRDIEISAFATRDASGKPICYVAIKHDVTERKRSEAALRRTELELTDFFENATIGLHWVGPDGIVLRVNQAELDLLGYTREEYVGHHIAEFHADPEVIADLLNRLQSKELVRDFEARMICKDKSIKHVRINSSVYWEDGQFCHTRCFTRDITDRKRTESRLALQHAVTTILTDCADFGEAAKQILRAACEHLNWDVGALWMVEEGDVLRCIEFCKAPEVSVDEFEEVTHEMTFSSGIGFPGQIWATGKPARINNVAEDENFRRTQAAESAGLCCGFGFPILIDDKVLGVLEFFSREMRDPDDELTRMVSAVGAQIGQFTKRKRAEEERADLLERERAARTDAERANRLKDEFLATVSHELRTPLNAVIGWSRMLNSGRLDPDSSAHALEVIERNAWAQKQIIEDILDVSRVITGKLQLTLGPVDLVTVVDAALDAVRPALEAKEIKIETIIDARLRIISGDADRLQQVVWNLLSNAAKFTPTKGKIEVRVYQDNSYVQIDVSDTGPGIDPIFLPHVFERFRQADGSTTRTHGGLGLGLAIVRHLVELHGGVITAENRTEGSGAIFSVRLRLPSGELRRETLATARESFAEAESEPVRLDDLRILIVDDEDDTLDLVTMELTERGARTTAVSSAKEALELLSKNGFDVLISDIAMPEIDGYKLMREVRKMETSKEQRIPAVALTAYASVQDRMRAILAGFNTHVAKPVEANELVTVVAGL